MLIALLVTCTAASDGNNEHFKTNTISVFISRRIAHPGYFDNRIPLKPALGGVCSLANYSVAYEETQSNRVSDFRDLCDVFSKAIFYDFIFLYCSWCCAVWRP